MPNPVRGKPVYKCVLIGEGGVGKTSITLRYTENRFDDHMRLTIGANFASKNVDIDGKQITLLLWDLGGQPRFRDVVSDYFRGARFAMAVYDSTRAVSLERLSDWLKKLQEIEPECELLFVGNKTDARIEGSGVTLEQGLEFATRYGADCLEVSAKTGDGIAELFENVAKRLCAKFVKPQSDKANVVTA